GDGCGGDVRDLCWNLPLVAQDVWTHDGWNLGEDPLLVQLRRDLLHLHAVPLLRHGWECAALPGVCERLHPAAHSVAPVYYRGCIVHRSSSTHLRVQPDS